MRLCWLFLNKHLARIQNAVRVENFSNLQIAINFASVSDTEKVNIFFIKRKTHSIIAHDNDSKNSAKAG